MVSILSVCIGITDKMNAAGLLYIVRGDPDSRANLMPIYGDLY